MITAIVDYRDNTLIAELPGGNMDLQTKLMSIGVTKPPCDIALFATDDGAVKVQIASDSDVGKHLCRLFTEHNTLGDVNTVATLMCSIDADIDASDFEQDILYDQYTSLAEFIKDLKSVVGGVGK